MQDRIWSAREVEAVVTSYFSMLASELKGEHFNKSEHRRRLARLLDDRSDSSIELKHQNISAVLIDLRFPWITGYKPRFNYQRLLAETVARRLDHEADVKALALAAVETRLKETPASEEMAIREAPRAFRPGLYAREPGTPRSYHPGHVDFFEREARNRHLGLLGEQFVVDFERNRLARNGKCGLADRVRWTAQEAGDGAGYDVLSFEVSGEERFIEVKTTTFGKEAPFYASANEVEFSRAFSHQYYLYRLFEFARAPKLYLLSGSLEMNFRLEAASFRASVS